MLLRDGQLVPFRSGTPLPPGRHSFTISADGYQPAIEIVEMQGRDREIGVSLRRDLIH
jgi:hypothetical protein